MRVSDWGLPRVKCGTGGCNPTILAAEGGIGYIVKRAKRAQRRESCGVECTRHSSRHRIYYTRYRVALSVSVLRARGSIAFVTTLALFTSVYVQFCGSSGRGSPNCRCYWSEVRTATLGEANEPIQKKYSSNFDPTLLFTFSHGSK